MSDINKIREFFVGDRFATENGMIIEEVDADHVVCSVELESKHYNAVNKVMGGVMFTLADFAFAVLANSEMKNPCVSQTSTITFLGVVKGKKLIAKAHYIKNGRSVAVAQIDVTDEFNTQVAIVTISGQKLGVK